MESFFPFKHNLFYGLYGWLVSYLLLSSSQIFDCHWCFIHQSLELELFNCPFISNNMSATVGNSVMFLCLFLLVFCFVFFLRELEKWVRCYPMVVDS